MNKFIFFLFVFLAFISCRKNTTDPISKLVTFKDQDSNVYHIVNIGSQKWMRENLKTAHYNNGDTIPEVRKDSLWAKLKTGGFCNYNNDTNYVSIFGRLYNWYSVNDSRNICPKGWHVPTTDYWKTLVNYLGGSSVAGGSLKEDGVLHWFPPNTGATNQSGFTAFSGGFRDINGKYGYIMFYTHFWSSSLSDSTQAWKESLSNSSEEVSENKYYKQAGYSIRCIKN